MIRLLPHWVITNKNPAFYDSESVSAIEQTGRVYAKMQELIEHYNKYVDDLNTYITEFNESINKDYEAFKVGINQKIKDFIDLVNLKLSEQDILINDTVTHIRNNFEEYLKNDLDSVLKELIQEGVLNEEILSALEDINGRLTRIESQKIELIHNPDTEELELKITYGEV